MDSESPERAIKLAVTNHLPIQEVFGGPSDGCHLTDKPLNFHDGASAFRAESRDVWLHRPLPKGATIGSGSFFEDSRGRWYINIPVELTQATQAVNAWVGIDLKTLATLSNG